MIKAQTKERTIIMTDYDNNNRNNENQPVNGEYHYRTYDLENRQ